MGPQRMQSPTPFTRFTGNLRKNLSVKCPYLHKLKDLHRAWAVLNHGGVSYVTVVQLRIPPNTREVPPHPCLRHDNCAQCRWILSVDVCKLGLVNEGHQESLAFRTHKRAVSGDELFGNLVVGEHVRFETTQQRHASATPCQRVRGA